MNSIALKAIELALAKNASVSIGADGSITLNGSATVTKTKSKKVNQYESTVVPKLMHGQVAAQVRKFETVGDNFLVESHSARTIYSAFNKRKQGCSVEPTQDPNVWNVTRTRYKRRCL